MLTSGLRASAFVVAAVLLISAAVALVGAASNIYWLATFDLFAERPSSDTTNAAWEIVRWIHYRDTGLHWIPLAAFLLWVCVAYRTLERDKQLPDLQHSSRSAVLGFLIPGLNLWRPLPVLRELWRASERHRLGRVPWQAMPAPFLVKVCWAAFDVGALAWASEYWAEYARRRVPIGDRDLVSAIRLADFATYTWLLQDIATVVGAGAGALIVLRVTRIQTQGRAPALGPAQPADARRQAV